jgi:hypothetical protein
MSRFGHVREQSRWESNERVSSLPSRTSICKEWLSVRPVSSLLKPVVDQGILANTEHLAHSPLLPFRSPSGLEQNARLTDPFVFPFPFPFLCPHRVLSSGDLTSCTAPSASLLMLSTSVRQAATDPNRARS